MLLTTGRKLTQLLLHMSNIDALTCYQQVVNNLSQTFVELSLELNITITKELCFGGRDKASPLSQTLSIQGQPMEQVQVFRYLNTKIDTSILSSIYNPLKLIYILYIHYIAKSIGTPLQIIEFRCSNHFHSHSCINQALRHADCFYKHL